MRRTIRWCLSIVVVVLPFFATQATAAADAEIEKLQQALVSSWLVEVQGEARTRTLNIGGLEKQSDGVWRLDATYGWSDARQTPVKTSLIVLPSSYRLELVTQANSAISSESFDLKSFAGTFTLRSGSSKQIAITRATAEEIAKHVSAVVSKAIIKPGPEVPAVCAAFVARWKGRWAQGNFGDQWLWLSEVDANCVVKYYYSDTPELPNSYKRAEIKDGRFSFLCNRSTNGTCVFTRHGDDLWANYSNPSGGTNSAVFGRLADGER